jgi:hypothetical protein
MIPENLEAFNFSKNLFWTRVHYNIKNRSIITIRKGPEVKTGTLMNTRFSVYEKTKTKAPGS